MGWGLLIDLLIAGLCIATMVYAAILNRSLSSLREGRDELRALVDSLSFAVQRAEAAMVGLRDTASGLHKETESRTASARRLLDELQMMIESGESLAERLSRHAEQAAGRRRGPVGTANTATREGASGREGENRGSEADWRAAMEEPPQRQGLNGERAYPDQRAGALARRDDEGFRSKAERDLAAAVRAAIQGQGG